jgi:hypothetical protein
MQLSMAKLGQLTPVQVYRAGKRLELFDGFKRARQSSDAAGHSREHPAQGEAVRVPR